MVDELKKVFQIKERFQSRSWGIFRIQPNICDGTFWKSLTVTGGNNGQSRGRSKSLGFVSLNSQTQKIYMIQINKRVKTN